MVLVFVGFGSHAQTVAPSPAIVAPAPTSGDVMRERISKAKAFIAVRNYNAAIYELENIRKETNDAAVQAVVNVLLMNSYLEQGDYKRSQELLNEFYAQQKTTRANASANYMAVASQVIKGARSRADRYKALGLSVSDRTLPLEALNDLEKMRETLELVVTQSKEIGQTPAKTADAMALLEEASVSRSMLSRDDYDAKRWKDELSDTRESLTNSRSVVLSAVSGEPTIVPQTTTTAQTSTAPPPVTQPIAESSSISVRDREVKNTTPPDTAAAQIVKPIFVPSAAPSPESRKEEPKPVVTVPSSPVAAGSTIEVGPLLSYATKQSPPVYPNAARTARQAGTVKVEVMVDENGEVAKVEKTTGPMMLQNAAKDAILKWKFRPFVRDGQPVKATGFVSFNFSL
ncbi:MAG: TonB family protein [Pyrinomonadaceae bacterium]